MPSLVHGSKYCWASELTELLFGPWRAGLTHWLSPICFYRGQKDGWTHGTVETGPDCVKCAFSFKPTWTSLCILVVSSLAWVKWRKKLMWTFPSNERQKNLLSILPKKNLLPHPFFCWYSLILLQGRIWLTWSSKIDVIYLFYIILCVLIDIW